MRVCRTAFVFAGVHASLFFIYCIYIDIKNIINYYSSNPTKLTYNILQLHLLNECGELLWVLGYKTAGATLHGIQTYSLLKSEVCIGAYKQGWAYIPLICVFCLFGSFVPGPKLIPAAFDVADSNCIMFEWAAVTGILCDSLQHCWMEQNVNRCQHGIDSSSKCSLQGLFDEIAHCFLVQ